MSRHLGIAVLIISIAFMASAPSWDSSDAECAGFENGGFAFRVCEDAPGEVALVRASGTGSVEIPSVASDGSMTYSVTAVDAGAFGGRNGTSYIWLPDSVVRIDSEAFSGCPSLERISFGESVSTGTESIAIAGDGFSIALDSAFLSSFSGKRFDIEFGLQSIDSLPEAVWNLSGWSPVYLMRVTCDGPVPDYSVEASITSFEGGMKVDIVNCDPSGRHYEPPSVRNGDGSISFMISRDYFFISSGSAELIPHSNLVSAIVALAGISVASFFIVIRAINKRRGG